METRQAEYKTDLGQMQAEVARRFDGLAVDNAKRETRYTADFARLGERIEGLAAENAKRETRLVVTFAGLLAVAVAFLSLQD